jgi:hypothetical protein
MTILRSVTGIMRIPGQIMELSVNGRVIRIKRIPRSVNGGSIQDNEDTQVRKWDSIQDNEDTQVS